MINDKVSEGKTILIVDESPSTFGVLFDYLTGFGFTVLVAHDGESGIEIARQSLPDLILLDARISGMDGFETCRRLKANEITKDIPIIFMTALAGTMDKVRGFSLGAVDYVTKPIQVEEVLARLRTHLTIQELQQSLAEKNACLEEEIAEREKLIAELDAFAHTVAHDLKNPLGVTISYGQFLNKYSTQMSLEDIQKYSETIMRNGIKMSNIIDELLLLASVRKEDLELEPVDMAAVLAEVQDRLAYMIEEYQAELIIPEEWPTALGYGPWVEEVWANYISNALKYGGQPPRVEVGATVQSDNLVKFWVKDNGNGLTPEKQVHLFVPFSRLDQARAEGHGLGLSIVQRIVEKLGGEVAVESEGIPGRGSIFSFTLPLASMSYDWSRFVMSERTKGQSADEGLFRQKIIWRLRKIR